MLLVIICLSQSNDRANDDRCTEGRHSLLEKALALPRSMQTPEGTDNDGVEHLLAMALEALVANR